MLRYLSIILLIVFLGSSDTRAGNVYDEVLPEFYKDYPESTVVNVVPDAEASLRGLLGYAVYLTITFKRKDSTKEESTAFSGCMFRFM